MKEIWCKKEDDSSWHVIRSTGSFIQLLSNNFGTVKEIV